MSKHTDVLYREIISNLENAKYQIDTLHGLLLEELEEMRQKYKTLNDTKED
jgi:hypothetical protein